MIAGGSKESNCRRRFFHRRFDLRKRFLTAWNAKEKAGRLPCLEILVRTLIDARLSDGPRFHPLSRARCAFGASSQDLDRFPDLPAVERAWLRECIGIVS
jgi:hypothetical protein